MIATTLRLVATPEDERALVETGNDLIAIVLAEPHKILAMEDLETSDFPTGPQQAAWEAICELHVRGQDFSIFNIEAELARRDASRGGGDYRAIAGRDFLTRLALGCSRARSLWTPERLRGLVVLLKRSRRDAAAALARVEESERLENEIDEIALRDVDHDDHRDRKLTPRLIEFFGAEEPDADDSEDWNIRDVLPREPALWGARMKGGKTWAAMDLGIAMATGVDWLGFENTRREPINVLGVLIEDGKRRLSRRLWELCRGREITPNDERLRQHLSITREPIRLPDDAKQLAKRLQGWTPKVIIVDNLTRVMVGDPNSTKDAAAFNKAWLQLADELGAAIILLHHTRKTGDESKRKGGDPFDTLRGSGDFGAAARHLIVSQPIEGGTTSEVYMRGNLDLRRENFVMGFERTLGADGRWTAKLSNLGEVDVIRAQVGDKKRTAKAEEQKRVAIAESTRRRNVALEIVQRTGACSTYQLGRALDMSDKGAAPILKELEADRVLVRDKKKGFVFPPKPEPAATQAELKGITE